MINHSYYTGLAHIFHASFITPKQRFWCEAVERDGQPVAPPWTVEYGNSSIDIWPGDLTGGRCLSGAN